MIRNHIAESSGGIEVTAALFDSYGFRIRDLDGIDVATIPDRFKNRVVETKDEDVLYGFLAEVVIDAENLVLAQNSFNIAVQGFGRFQVVTEGLLDHEPPPLIVFLVGQSRCSQLLHDGGKEFGSGCQIEKVVPFGIALAINVRQAGGQCRKSVGICEIPALIRKTLNKPGESLAAAVFFRQETGYLITELFQAEVVHRNAHHCKIFGQKRGLGQVEESGNQFAFGQITGSAEQDHGTGAGCFTLLIEFRMTCRSYSCQSQHPTEAVAIL